MTPFGETLCALVIDIDDTLVRVRAGSKHQELFGQPLLALMCEMAVATNGMSREEATEIIKRVDQTVVWWGWRDFIRALDLDAHAFWRFAYQCESAYIEPVHPHLPALMASLCDAGYRLFVASNNPSSGILHKLRLANLAGVWGSPFFARYFGATELRAMKGAPEFWSGILANTGLRSDHMITIGDLWSDDVLAPRVAGICRNIYLNWAGEEQDPLDGVVCVSSWDEARQYLLEGSTLSCSGLGAARTRLVSRKAKQTMPSHCRSSPAAASPNAGERREVL